MLSAVAGLVLLCSAQAAELDGVTLADRQWVGRTELLLNGIGLRTYSFLQIPIYVGGLYLVHRDSDAERILRSPDMKLLDMRFLHDVDQERARQAWRDGFARNCGSPCDLPAADIERFLAAVPAMRKGDRYTILFTTDGAEISANGQAIGRIANRRFATAMLATFIGPRPATPRLKRELLGQARRPEVERDGSNAIARGLPAQAGTAPPAPGHPGAPTDDNGTPMPRVHTADAAGTLRRSRFDDSGTPAAAPPMMQVLLLESSYRRES